MATVRWDSAAASTKPRKLTSTEISDITNSLTLSRTPTAVQMNIINIHREKLATKLATVKILPAKIPELKNTILKQFYKSIVAPGEAVGVNAAQNIGEPTTQLTLNSVAYDTLIVVRTGTEYDIVKIGDFIEKTIEDSVRLEHYENDTTYAELPYECEVPSVNEEGMVSWKKIEAVTRHPVVNKDGSNTVLRVTTRHGREVIATKAKSFLKLIDGKITGVNGSDLRVGDYLPVNKKPLTNEDRFEFNLRKYLPPTEYTYASDLAIADKLIDKDQSWWRKYHGVKFTLPYRCSGALSSTGQKPYYAKNCVYPLNNAQCKAEIPEQFPLNYQTGYLFGAYCAEGCVTKFQLSIANNSDKYLQPIVEFCEKYKITYKKYRQENNIKEGWKSSDIRLYSSIITDVLGRTCGVGSANKFVAPEIIWSNNQCRLGFLDAYIGGNGHINTAGKNITMYSVSHRLLLNVQQLLNNIGVYSYIRTPKKQLANNRSSQNILQGYELNVRNGQAQNLAFSLSVTHEKHSKLDALLQHNYKYTYFQDDVIPNEINGQLHISNREDADFPDLIFDEIVKIDEIQCPNKYVYDLTVAETRTFISAYGLGHFDTFHSAGQRSANVTLGFPRAKELFNATRSPSNPTCTVFFTRHNKNPADLHKLIDKLSKTIVNQLLDNWDVIDPIPEELDYWHQLWMDINNWDDITEDEWCIRLKFHVGKLYEHDLTVKDVAKKLDSAFTDIRCIPSPLNLGIVDVFIDCSEVDADDRQAARQYYVSKIVSPKLRGLHISGVNGITEVYRRKIGSGEPICGIPLKEHIAKKVGTEEEWIVDTEGTNLAEIFSRPGVDTTRTYSNDMWETANLLGIEAARLYLLNEFMNIVNSGGASINPIHVYILVAKMTYTGTIRAIARFGVETSQYDPIARATFEEVMSQLVTSAIFSERDNLSGISSNIVLGTRIKAGTGMMRITDRPVTVKKASKVSSNVSTTSTASTSSNK